MKKRRSLWISLFAVVIGAVLALGLVLASGWTPKLGLDLDGGLSVVYKTAKPVNSDQMNTITTILNERIAGYGASGASVQQQGNDEIAVSIPGAKNSQAILAKLGNTAQLYFRPATCVAAPYTAPKTGPPSSGALPTCAAKSELTASNIDVTQNPSSATQPYNSNLSSIPADSQYVTYPSTTPAQDTQNATVLLPFLDTADYGTARYELGPAPMNGTAVKSASAQLSTTGQWTVNISLTSQGASEFDTLAQQQFHAIIALDLDAQIISAPLTQPTQSSFSSFAGSVQISGGFTAQQAQTLATELNYGSLPVALNKLTVQTVSPTLGRSSLQAGLISGIAGLLLVMLYVIAYYRLLGLVVVAGLAITGAYLWAIIALMGQSGTTIDLAGIIGIIVSIGITVDSYIVYFERLKDETRSGRTVRTSVDRGFKSAFRTVLAADLVSFMGAAILYVLSIGEVKGFALFLGISTALDVFITYFFTRPFVILLGTNASATEAKGMGVARGLGLESQGAR